MEKITIQYRVKDYLDACRIHYYQNKLNVFLTKFFFIVMILLSGFLFIEKYASKREIDFFALSLLIGSLWFLFYEWTILPFDVKKFFNHQKKYFEEVTLIFEENEIINMSSISKDKIKLLYKHIKTPKMLLMYATPISFIFLPKKYCISEEQYETICNIVANFPQGN